MSLIHDLYEYAKTHGLGLVPTKKQDIAYRLVISTTGVVLKAHKETANVLIESRGCTDFPYKLYDMPEYVLGVPEDETSKGKARAASRLKLFWERALKDVSKAGDTEALAAIQAVIEHPKWLKGLKVIPLPKKDKPLKGWVAIALAEEGSFLLDRPLVREEEVRDFEKTLQPGPDKCLLSGESCTAVRLHGKITGLPGTGGGVPLVSYDAQTSGERGLSQGEHLPTSPKAMKQYTAAGNALVETNMASLGKTIGVLFFGPAEAHVIVNAISRFTKKENWEAAWAALDSLPLSDELLRIVAIKGSKGRAATLHNVTIPVREVRENLLGFRDYFTGYLVGGPTPPTTPPTIGQLVCGTKDHIPETLRLNCILSILLGKPIPRMFLNLLLQELQSKNIANNTYSAQAIVRWLDFNLKTARTPMDFKQAPNLDAYVQMTKEHNDGANYAAYHFGRLVALLVAMKHQVHHGSFSTNIALTLCQWAVNCPRTLCQEGHRQFLVLEPNLRKYGGDAGRKYRELWEDGWTRIQSCLSTANQPLTGAQSGEFARGYQQQSGFNHHLTEYMRAVKEAKKTEPEAAE